MIKLPKLLVCLFKPGLTNLMMFTSIKSQSPKQPQPYLTFCQKNPTNYYCLTNAKPTTAIEIAAQPVNNNNQCLSQRCLYTIPPNTPRICAKSKNNYKTFVSSCALNNYNCQNNASKLFYFVFTTILFKIVFLNYASGGFIQ